MGDRAGWSWAGVDPHPTWYSQALLSPQQAPEVPGARVSLEFRWAQRHRLDLAPPEIPGMGQERGSFQGPQAAGTGFPEPRWPCLEPTAAPGASTGTDSSTQGPRSCVSDALSDGERPSLRQPWSAFFLGLPPTPQEGSTCPPASFRPAPPCFGGRCPGGTADGGHCA